MPGVCDPAPMPWHNTSSSCIGSQHHLSELPAEATDEGDVEIWNDPRWTPALDALEGYSTADDGSVTFTGKSDPAPLAELLLGDDPLPAQVRQRLAVLLNPPWGTKGPRATVTIPIRWNHHEHGQRVLEMYNLRKQLETAISRNNGKLEAAIAEVSDLTGYSRSHLMNAWSYDEKRVILEGTKYNPIT